MFKNHSETPGLFQFQAFAQQTFLAGTILRLTSVTEAMDRLRRQTQMPHHRNPHAHQSINHRHYLGFCAFKLHGGSTGFLQEAPRRCNGEILAALIAQKRQVADQQRLTRWHALKPTRYGLCVVQHPIEAYRKRRGMAEGHHGEGITNENGISSCSLNPCR